jgi:polyhydroxybutyrate depolymerase
VRFLDELVDRLAVSGCVDDDRVSAVGVSNGGGMAARFACEADDRLAGLVSVAGGYSSLPRCTAQRPISVLEIHGTADAVVPYWGRAGDPQGGVVHWLTQWVRRDACPLGARRQSSGPSVQRLDWTPCRAGTSVTHLRLIGGQHAWPGADPPDRGPSFGVSAAEEAWSFLRGRRRASAVEHEG